ncbi:histidinol-phosphatase HisJ [Sediminibacillus dalangtanensis]|uniref:Histidinol-phosphatase n=1 Tax=Sediminibacillus dalangtanensis TaxID=2729421 RepID=A0ABX7VY54_9BACI|nr:histidinol-phosphatase HisJ [Sediminibacillus dalangtanensis]QTM99536.1 histidinol-phosphatase HisJ [Sediminibacillus dalangtanensis]
MNISGDFHVHTPFCPHGTKDRMEAYVKQAIESGLTHLTFTEHAPLPAGFSDPAPTEDSSMPAKSVETYLKEAQQLKKTYRDKLVIQVGLEVDFIAGFEKETCSLLEKWGPRIDDAILSVHMLRSPEGKFVCLDYSVEEFASIVSIFGSVEAVYQVYYRTLQQAITSELGRYKPKRLGHITLVEKFIQAFPPARKFEQEIVEILSLMAENGMELDINTAGLYKEYCQSIYPAEKFIRQAYALGIPLVPGSDSHQADHIARGFEDLPDLHYAFPEGISNSSN